MKLTWVISVCVMTILRLVSSGSVCAGGPGDEYMCVDWSVGSERMAFAQYNYKQQSGEDVVFGVGSYGSSENKNIGKCYKFFTNPPSNPIIAQVTNYGADIKSSQFDIQTGGGGFGVWNACAERTDRTRSNTNPCPNKDLEDIPIRPQFPGSKSGWNRRCGGPQFRSQCDELPKWPSTLRNRPPRGPRGSSGNEPNLQVLCERSFDWGVRINDNVKKITRGSRVPCPTPLIEITNLKRTDDRTRETMRPGTLTTTMDCCAPPSSYPSITGGNKLKSPFNKLSPCKRDGYTRW